MWTVKRHSYRNKQVKEGNLVKRKEGAGRGPGLSSSRKGVNTTPFRPFLTQVYVGTTESLSLVLPAEFVQRTFFTGPSVHQSFVRWNGVKRYSLYSFDVPIKRLQPWRTLPSSSRVVLCSFLFYSPVLFSTFFRRNPVIVDDSARRGVHVDLFTVLRDGSSCELGSSVVSWSDTLVHFTVGVVVPFHLSTVPVLREAVGTDSQRSVFDCQFHRKHT